MSYAAYVTEIDSRRVLWTNLTALMDHHWEGENLTRLAREAKIGPGSATRMKQQTTSVGIELLDKVGRVFGVEAWQLLVPGLNPKSPPTLMPASEAERAFYKRVADAMKAYKDTEH